MLESLIRARMRGLHQSSEVKTQSAHEVTGPKLELGLAAFDRRLAVNLATRNHLSVYFPIATFPHVFPRNTKSGYARFVFAIEVQTSAANSSG